MCVGIDGEGQGRDKHRYVLLAASDEQGINRWHTSNQNGLSTEECLHFIVFTISPKAKLFAYSFNYDLTKMLADIDDETLYLLFRPEERQREGKEASKGPWPVKWRSWLLNLQGTKFTVEKIGYPGKRVIWDIWKFYQSKFVSALEDWKVGTPEDRARMTHMKDKRADFDKETPEAVLAYCYKECQYMAELARRLIQAHVEAGLKLTSFYGAGSSASAMLKGMGIREKIMVPPASAKVAMAAGFFGGRFENSVIGTIDGPVYSYDISSAYPYQLCFLPCLVHGVWEKTENRADIESASAALIRYGFSGTTNSSRNRSSWCPFPFRTPKGTITFPSMSGGGWVWRDEYLAGEELFPEVYMREAWVYHTDCDCAPFKKIPEYYLERCKIGKEGPGIVIKLGCNSCYGKLAQSVGHGPFNSWVWSGITTSGCRAQILKALGLHKDWSNLLMIATDGIHTREKLDMPKPKDTGTDILVTDQSTGKTARKPLGGWEFKPIEKGVFYARPGVYFPLNPTADEIKAVRGRGVGRGVVLENWELIVDTWEQTHDIHAIARVANVSRFCGAKSSISRAQGPNGFVYNRACGNHQHSSKPEPAYGEWIVRKVQLGFHPMPKRSGLASDGVHLLTRMLPEQLESTPYKKAIESEESKRMRAYAEQMLEQPDGDLSDYEVPPS